MPFLGRLLPAKSWYLMSPFATFHRSSRLCPSLWKSFSSYTPRISVTHSYRRRCRRESRHSLRRMTADSTALNLKAMHNFAWPMSEGVCQHVRLRLPRAPAAGRMSTGCLQATQYIQHQVIEMRFVRTYSEQMTARHVDQLHNKTSMASRYAA